ILLSDFPTLVASRLAGSNGVATLFLVIFSVGLAFGSLLVNWLLKGRVSAEYVPASALAMAGSMIALWRAVHALPPRGPRRSMVQFAWSPGAWPILVELAVLAIAGGMFIVPLYAILQTNSPEAERSRVIAANNIVNALVAVIVTAIVVVLQAKHVSLAGVIAV